MKNGKHVIEIRDSWKLLPFSVKNLGKSFKTKHQKLDMKYEGFRYAGCEITEEEKRYIANDVLVVKEVLEIMYTKQLTKLTIGSCCMSEFKTRYHKHVFRELFPDLREVPCNEEKLGYADIWHLVNSSYGGGWCYVVEGKERQIKRCGLTADVNSLYPSMMHSSSGNYYPVGKPVIWFGNIPKSVLNSETPIYYFVRVKTRFKLRKGYLPFIHIRKNQRYKAKECLKTSDVCIKGKYYREYTDYKTGEVVQAIPELTLTMTDWELFQKHYELSETTILGGCVFRAEIGIFDDYINYWAEIKKNSKGAQRTLAKLFLNNLYGKMATNENSSYKIISLGENGLEFNTIPEMDKKVGYIPCGSAITSYARRFTITAAQANYYGVNKRGFIYADTDSIHCDLLPEEIKGIKVDPVEFNCWKLESYWDAAFFTRTKTYIEHVTHEDGEKIEKPYYNIKCAGMPEKSKNYFNRILEKDRIRDDEDEPENVKEFVNSGIDRSMDISSFDIGLEVPGKLIPKQIRGGVVLKDTPFKMRGGI